MGISVLVVDDDRAVAEYCRLTIAEAGYTVSAVYSGAEALEVIERQEIDVVLSDVRMPGMDGVRLLREISALADNAPTVILMTGYASIASAVEAVKLGAHEYIEKPVQPQRLENTIRRAAELREVRARNLLLRFQLEAADADHGMWGTSRAMLAVREQILRVAGRTQPVLITGETGTGKELVARAIHEHQDSNATRRPFITVDCGALSESIAESELFGDVRGAYTGAVGERRGLLESSAGGTLFLDEIGELPPAIQVKLLRVLQDRDFRPLGSDTARRFTGRVVAATNRDLTAKNAANEFRPDLYYRLNVHTIHVPPLRTRSSDVPLLVRHFIQKHGEGRVLAAAPEVNDFLCSLEWPGNVRELENCIIRMLAHCQGRVLEAKDIPAAQQPPAAGPAAEYLGLREAERAAIVAAMEQAQGNISAAARQLGISTATMYRKLAACGVATTQRRSRSAAAAGGA